MLLTCETCPLNTTNVGDGTVLRAWRALAEKPEVRARLIDPTTEDPELFGVDSDDRRLANSRAIAQCFTKKCITGECAVPTVTPVLTTPN